MLFLCWINIDLRHWHCIFKQPWLSIKPGWIYGECVWPASSLIPNSFCLCKRCSASHPVEGHLKCKLSLSTQQNSLFIHCPSAHPCMASKDSTTLGSHPLLHPNSGTLMIKFNSISRFKSSFHQMTNFPPPSLFSIFFFHPRICTYGMVTLQKLVFNRHFLPNPSYLWEKTTMDGMKF